MHCPICGTISSTDKKFCRSCGLELGIISQLVAAHLSVADRALLPRASGAGKPHRMIALLCSGGISFIIGLALLIMEGQPDWTDTVGVLLLLAGTLIAAYGALFPRWQIKIDLRIPLSRPAILPLAESTESAPARAYHHDSTDSSG